METVFDVQQLLKKFGTYIYTGDRIGDLGLMELEVDELFHEEFLPASEYQKAKLILRRKATQLQKERK